MIIVVFVKVYLMKDGDYHALERVTDKTEE
jgi:hypothetical protein